MNWPGSKTKVRSFGARKKKLFTSCVSCRTARQTSVPPSHAAAFFDLLGGGRVDGGFDGSLPTAMRLAILPGTTHYTIFESTELTAVADAFLLAP